MIPDRMGPIRARPLAERFDFFSPDPWFSPSDRQSWQRKFHVHGSIFFYLGRCLVIRYRSLQAFVMVNNP